jgi:plasmid stabilization system protein ParE
VTLRVELTPEAEADIDEAHLWYSGRGLGLGEEFARSLDACLESVSSLPDSFPAVHRHVRRALLRRFPYCAFYIVEPTRVVVVGVFHARRDPQAWRRRGR